MVSKVNKASQGGDGQVLLGEGEADVEVAEEAEKAQEEEDEEAEAVAVSPPADALASIPLDDEQQPHSHHHHQPTPSAVLPVLGAGETPAQVPSNTLLYTSHFAATWGQRMWEFSIAIFLTYLRPGTLLYVSVHGFAAGVAVMLLAPLVGEWVDRNKRLYALRVVLLAQEMFVCVACLIVLVLLANPMPTNATFIGLLGVLLTLASCATLASTASTIVIQRDWVVVMAKGDKVWLARTNATMRTIDLFCKVAAPALAGVVMDAVTVSAAAMLIASWNVVAVVAEYAAMHKIYARFPALAVKKSANPGRGRREHSSRVGHVLYAMATPLRQFRNGIAEYWRQPVRLAALSLAFLYLTVLSFGSVLVAYMVWKGMSVTVIGVVRGLGALLGLVGSVAYPTMVRRLDLERAGLVGIWIMWVLVALAMLSFWLPGATLGLVLLAGGVTVSRFGLWTFDLSVSQQIQQGVHEDVRGVVNGVQTSLQSFFGLLSYLLVMVLSKPEDFWIPSMVSFGMVTSCTLLFTYHSEWVVVGAHGNHALEDHPRRIRRLQRVAPPPVTVEVELGAAKPSAPAA